MWLVGVGEATTLQHCDTTTGMHVVVVLVARGERARQNPQETDVSERAKGWTHSTASCAGASTLGCGAKSSICQYLQVPCLYGRAGLDWADCD